MKEFFMNAIDTIKDDRFGWRFKICNIIMNDYLRIYLATNAIAVKSATEFLQRLIDNGTIKNRYVAHRLEKVYEELREIMRW